MFIACTILGLLVLAASSGQGRARLAAAGRAVDGLANGLLMIGAGLTLLTLLAAVVLWVL